MSHSAARGTSIAVKISAVDAVPHACRCAEEAHSSLSAIEVLVAASNVTDVPLL